MEDIAPKLLEQIKTRFSERVAASPKIRALEQKIKAGSATYADAGEYAYRIGEALSQALEDFLTTEALPDGRMYYNIAQRVLEPLLAQDHAIVSQAAAMVQASLNQKAGLSIKPQTVAVNQDRISGIIDKVSDAEDFSKVAWVLDEPIKNSSQAIVDAILKENVDFQGKAGLRPKIIRKAVGKCCPWCSKLAGEHTYPTIDREVYRRHERCRCIVEYDPGDGKKVQNVHTKQWITAEERAKIEKEKQIGLKSIAQELAEHPARLASYTPASLKAEMEQQGLEVKPLKRGSLKDIPFEQGGGYKTNFEDGGLFQYHPEKKSHHGGAYYKISTGTGGTHRYGLDGTEKKSD